MKVDMVTVAERMRGEGGGGYIRHLVLSISFSRLLMLSLTLAVLHLLNTDLQSQNVVSAHFSSTQLLLLDLHDRIHQTSHRTGDSIALSL